MAQPAVSASNAPRTSFAVMRNIVIMSSWLNGGRFVNQFGRSTAAKLRCSFHPVSRIRTTILYLTLIHDLPCFMRAVNPRFHGFTGMESESLSIPVGLST